MKPSESYQNKINLAGNTRQIDQGKDNERYFRKNLFPHPPKKDEKLPIPPKGVQLSNNLIAQEIKPEKTENDNPIIYRPPVGFRSLSNSAMKSKNRKNTISFTKNLDNTQTKEIEYDESTVFSIENDQPFTARGNEEKKKLKDHQLYSKKLYTEIEKEIEFDNISLKTEACKPTNMKDQLIKDRIYTNKINNYKVFSKNQTENSGNYNSNSNYNNNFNNKQGRTNSFVKPSLFTRSNNKSAHNLYGDEEKQKDFVEKINEAKYTNNLTKDQENINKLKKNSSNTYFSENTMKNEIKSRENKDFFRDFVGGDKKSLKEDYYVNIEDLLLLEEKISKIYSVIDSSEFRLIQHSCYDWWNFSNFCSIGGKFENYFQDNASKIIIKETTIIELITVIICYDLSYVRNTFELYLEHLKNLFIMVHQNFLTICDSILSKVSHDSINNIWVKKLTNIVSDKLIKSIKLDNILLLKKNNDLLKKILRKIIEIPSDRDLIKLIFPNINKLHNLSIQELNDVFRRKSLKIDNKNASIPASLIIDEENGREEIIGQFKTLKPIKDLTLVLDLDETLIHFQISDDDENKGILSLRPGIYKFLDSMSKYYEMMIFTAATHDYADPIINAIEKNKKYFTHRFYRQHTTIIDGDFVKDISRIGRNLSKMIIIDNMPQNFKLQKENGIFIKTFYGDDNDDTAFFDLIPILTSIAESSEKDIRKSLYKFKDEILRKVTSNISKNSK